ncbi:MAG: hypothetical protein ACOX60_09145 [Massiliimalia sp.]|jgi:membrane protein YdbS with pleckstrin-like domain
MKYETLPKKVLLLWECLAAAIAVAFAVLTVIIFAPRTLIWYLLLWLIGAAAILTMFLYLPLLFISTQYLVLKDRIMVSKGVIFHQTQWMPCANISFITVLKNPFTKLLDLSTLIISAPGARIFILLMSHRRAVEIAKELSYEHKFKE